MSLSSHVLMIATTVRYSLSLLRFNMYGGMARFSYRLSFVAAAVTYGIVVYKGWRSRAKMGAKQPTGMVGYLADENIQYLSKWCCLLVMSIISLEIYH